MPSLFEVQSAMRARLLDEANPVAAALLAEALMGADRLSIYHNTSRIALTNTLRVNYPAVQRLVGEDFFAAAADIFITQEPPRMACLDFYGAAIPEFLERFQPAASLPYLPDVARLERAVSRALHAAAAKELAPAELADLPQSAQGSVSFVPHPSVGLLSSNYPVDTIWRAVLAPDDAALAAIDLNSGSVWLLVERTAGPSRSPGSTNGAGDLPRRCSPAGCCPMRSNVPTVTKRRPGLPRTSRPDVSSESHPPRCATHNGSGALICAAPPTNCPPFAPPRARSNGRTSSSIAFLTRCLLFPCGLRSPPCFGIRR